MAQKRNLSATPTRRHAAPLRVPAPPRALHWGLSVKPRRCSHHLAAAPQRSQVGSEVVRAFLASSPGSGRCWGAWHNKAHTAGKETHACAGAGAYYGAEGDGRGGAAGVGACEPSSPHARPAERSCPGALPLRLHCCEVWICGEGMTKGAQHGLEPERDWAPTEGALCHSRGPAMHAGPRGCRGQRAGAALGDGQQAVGCAGGAW